ncbi:MULTISPECIES: SPOR domain-containing protein [Thioalkalivibrio]|uniref:SPOR domain-containing protein n=1 Tax=Thioalkalivibrio halophilus TaxID=252474 RepID=A0A1V2ZVK1_9GAMM|nr:MULTISPECIES: SPOR domain-containing protein [Thioalkalivibrio]OOC09076.1 hypothetical protein B1A74_12885 [Thioalkalivibrio halophilus]
MINLLITRRQLFLAVFGAPIATVLLFVLGVYSGAAIGAPNHTGVEDPTPSVAADARDEADVRAFSPAALAARLEHDAGPAEPVTPMNVEKSAEAHDEADASERYSIQAGVFSERANARQLSRELGTRGYDSQLEVVDVPEHDSEHFRVRIGSFDSRAAAEEAMEAYRDDQQADAFLVSRAPDRS